MLIDKFETIAYYQYIMLNPNVAYYKFCSYNCLIASTEMIIKYTTGMYLLAFIKKCYLITPKAIYIAYIFNVFNYAENYIFFCIHCFTSTALIIHSVI